MEADPDHRIVAALAEVREARMVAEHNPTPSNHKTVEVLERNLDELLEQVTTTREEQPQNG